MCGSGQTVTEMFQADRQVEVEAIDRLKRGIEVMRNKGDITSANIFESILADEEHHIDYLDTQLELVEKLGEALYIAQLIEQPEQLTAAGRRQAARRYGGFGERPPSSASTPRPTARRCPAERRGAGRRPGRGAPGSGARTNRSRCPPCRPRRSGGVCRRPPSACSLTCFSVMPKHEQTYTRFTSRRIVHGAVPMIGEANLTLPADRGATKRASGARIACDPRPTAS